MKAKMLLVFTAITGVVAIISVAEQTNKTLFNRLKSDQLESEQVEHDENSDETATIDSEEIWGRHEPFKNCTPCHGDRPERASQDELPLVAEVPELCYICHGEYVDPGVWVHGPVATGECLLCHEPHKASNPSLLSEPIPELCYHCHETKTLRLVASHSKESYTRCNDCHIAHMSPGRMLLKEEFLKTDAGLVFLGKHPFAQPRPTLVDCRESLSGLEGVEVIPVVDGLELLKSYGAPGDLLKTQVERQLKSRGIKILQPQDQTSKRSTLYVHLRLMEVPSFRRPGQVDALSGSFNLFLQQTVELLPTPGETKRRYCSATTWDTGAIFIWGTSQVEEGLKEAVEVLVGRFSRDYVEANPKVRASASTTDE